MPHTDSIMTSKRWSVHWNYYNQAVLTWRAVMGSPTTKTASFGYLLIFKMVSHTPQSGLVSRMMLG
jgi:hypothetical protein